MAKTFLLIFSLIFSINLMAQTRPSDPPPPPNDPGGPIPFDIYLVASSDPKAPPTDPADAGDLLISKYEVGEEEGVFVNLESGDEQGGVVITADARGETLTISDGRGVGLILVLAADWRVVGGLILAGEGQGRVVKPNFGTDRISITCGEAIYLIGGAGLLDEEVLDLKNISNLTDCQVLKSILVDIKPNVIYPLEPVLVNIKPNVINPLSETGTIL